MMTCDPIMREKGLSFFQAAPAVIVSLLFLAGALTTAGAAVKWQAEKQSGTAARGPTPKGGGPAPGAAGPARVGPAKRTFPDPELLDQDGRRVHFYTDLIKDKVVVINFIFTSCTSVCPGQGATFARLQTLLGDRVGKDVYLLSISLDPATDRPPRLRQWGEKFGAKPGWTLVTGAPPELSGLLRAFPGAPTGTEDHGPVLFIGNDATGEWIYANGLALPESLLSRINGLLR